MLSIIVPVFNSEAYLPKCIESIMHQTYTDFEVIVVDDGSTDNSLSICQKYASMDNRIKVIHNCHGGVVLAKKTGVCHSNGDFIGFVDSDDFIEPNYFEILLNVIIKFDVDIVCCGCKNLIVNSMDGMSSNKLDEGIYKSEEIRSVALYTGKFYEYGILPTLYTKVFKRNILINNQLAVPDEIVIGDDAAVVFPTICDSSMIAVINYYGYNYVRHPGSLTTNMREDEPVRIKALINYLINSFEKRKLIDMKDSLNSYAKFITTITDIRLMDYKKEMEILSPYGGVRHGDRVVIYGAGVLGKEIYSYINDDGRADVVAWIDRNFNEYLKQGLNVENPEHFLNSNNEYDYVLIAIITESVADNIREYLLKKGVANNKIKWFDKSFRIVNFH